MELDLVLMPAAAKGHMVSIHSIACMMEPKAGKRRAGRESKWGDTYVVRLVVEWTGLPLQSL